MMFSLIGSDDEGEEALLKKSQKKNKKSNEAVEDPERLARTVFVGNLPVAFTRKVRRQTITELTIKL